MLKRSKSLNNGKQGRFILVAIKDPETTYSENVTSTLVGEKVNNNNNKKKILESQWLLCSGHTEQTEIRTLRLRTQESEGY